MALIFIDGFDHYPTADLLEKWNMRGGNFEVLGSNYGRFGGQGLRVYGTSGYLKKLILGSKSTIYFGGAFYKDTSGQTTAADFGMLSFQDESSIVQIAVRLNPSYGFSVYQGDGTLLGSSADSLVTDQKWYYLEAKVTISATVGVVEVKLNGTQIINLTSQDTKNGSDYIGYVSISGEIVNKYFYFDDLYIDDAQFHGDCRIRTFLPDVDGNSADFTRSTGSNDYECVDETPSNEDTDYISSDTLNHKSIFGITTGSLPTVKGIQLNNHCKLDEAGARKITPIIRSNSTDYQGTESNALVEDYAFESEIFEDDPDDSGVWTQTKLEAAEFGLEITT